MVCTHSICVKSILMVIILNNSNRHCIMVAHFEAISNLVLFNFPKFYYIYFEKVPQVFKVSF